MVGLIDIGGTKLLATVADNDSRLHSSIRRDTPKENPLETLFAMLDEARDNSPLEAIGMAVPGPFDREIGSLINPPGQPVSWHGLALREHFSQRYGCPVYLENDANCAALAEAHFGAGRGYGTVVYYTVSTNLGAGMVHNGQLWISRHDTEPGHQILWPEFMGGPKCDCGAHGCLAILSSGTAIAQRFGKRGEDLNDPAAWEWVGRWLGIAVVNITTVTDCHIVVFGGGVINSWDKFAPTLMDTVRRNLFYQPLPEIAQAQLGEDRNLWGALALTRQTAAV